MTEHTAEHVDRLQFRVLGPVQVHGENGRAIDVGGSKPRLVLVQLLLSPNRMVSTDALIDALWGEDPPSSARRSLQSHVARLRSALGGDDAPVRSQPPGYVLAVDIDQVDLWRSEEFVRQARAALASDPRAAYDLARQARSEWTGEPLADLAAHDQLVAQRRRLDQLWLDVIELELDAELAVGDTAAVVERLESLVIDRPGHEPFWARLMTANYRLGRQADALRAFQRARTALLESLGIDPSPELQRLEAAILGQAAELDDAVQPQACPYKGLASYQIDDADRFFGRDDLVAELVEAVRTSPFVVVVGSSGAGKSSALRAGLVKEIEARKVSDFRHASIITPGAAPLRSVYQLSQSADVVVVDQFEELFTLTDDQATQREFVRLLVARLSDGGNRVVISLRADFYGSCTKLPELAPMLARRQVVVGPLSEHELRAVITRPAEDVGLSVAEELVDSIVAEAIDQAGALPLVSHALVETWHRRTDNQLTLRAYRDAGSIAGAIARTAERVYGSFQPAQRIQAEHLFLRLIEPGEASEHARRKVSYGQLEGSSIDREVIDLLVEARLLTAGADGIEIAHEALIAAWPRLQSWIDDDRDGIRMHRHLTSAASAWAELGGDEGELYRGARLAAALSWVDEGTRDLSALEREFVEAAAAVSETELRKQTRANRRLRILVAASVVGVIVAAIGTYLAISQASGAKRGRKEAEAAQLVATIRGAPDLSGSAVLLLAVEAHRRASTAATEGALLDAIAQNSGPAARGHLDVLTITGSAPISSNGGVLVTIDDNVLGKVFDARTLKLRAQGLHPAPDVVVDTGSRLLGLSASSLETADLETGKTVGPALGVTASQVALSPDGTTLAVANPTDESETHDGVFLYDVASGRQRLTMGTEVGGSIRHVTFSPDGRHVLAVARDSDALAWDTATGAAAFESNSQGATFTHVAMSPSNMVIALGRDDGRVEIWKSGDGRKWVQLDTRSTFRDPISWIDFDSQSRRMVSTDAGGRAIVWDTTSGAVAAGPLNFNGSGNAATFFRPDSETSLVTVDPDGNLWQWELQRNDLLTSVPGVNLGATVSASPEALVLVSSSVGMVVHDPSNGKSREVRFGAGLLSIRGVAASADGTRVVVVYDGGKVELRDAISGALLTAFDRGAKVDGGIMVALDRGGTRIAFQAHDQRVEVVDDKGARVDTIGLTPDRQRLQALSLSDDGRELVVSTDAGEAIWYDVDGVAASSIAERGTGFDAQFVADGRIAVVGGGEAQIIDPRSPQATRRFSSGIGATRLAVDSTGRLLATSDQSGLIQLWDAKTRVTVGAPLPTPSRASPTRMRFSTDGRYLVVAGPQETTWVKVWPADWQPIACRLVTEPLSSYERERYLGSLKTPELCR